MVSGQTVGTAGVGLGVFLIIFDFNEAGYGLLILGVLGAILVEAWNASAPPEGKR